MIPKIVHQICFDGSENLSEPDKKCVKSTRTIYNNYQYILWDFDLLNKYNYFNDMILKDVFENIRTYVKNVDHEHNYRALLSDILRYKVINQFGGLYFDIDVENIKQIDDYLLNDYDDLICRIPYPYGAGGIDGIEISALFGCKDSLLYKTAYELAVHNVMTYHVKNIKENYNLVKYSGPNCFTVAFNKIKNKLNEKVYELPTESYYPYMWTSEEMIKYENITKFPGKNVYGIHRWRGSWRY